MHILLAISIISVLISSAFLTLNFKNKKIYSALSYFFLLVFGQVVVTYEFLSLFSAINPWTVTIINFFVLAISAVIFKKSGKKPEFGEEISSEVEKIKFALNHDRWLDIVAVVFTVFLIVSGIYCYVIPTVDGDAFTYHIARLPYWYEFHNLNHFEIADARAIVMPINSEIFYFWAYSFIKSDILVRFLSFFSYIFFVFGARGFLKELKVPMNLSLWTILATTSMYNVMFSVSSSESNLTIVSLIVISLYLFFVGVKGDKKLPLFFATVAYALAIGTKTPSLQMLPAFFVSCAVIAYCYKKKDFYKPLLYCGGFLVLNFLIFGAYNYVLNFIDFGNPISSAAVATHHKFMGGFKAFVADIIRYFAMFINFSGMDIPYGTGVQFSEAMWRIVTALSGIVIALLGINPEINTVISEKAWFKEGNRFENMMGLGILGFLLFLPAIVISLKKIKTSKRNLIIGSIALGYSINVLVLSCTLGYMVFSIRFIMGFVMCAFPVLIFMFMKKKKSVFRKVIAVIMIYSFTIGFYCYERKFPPFLSVKMYEAGSLEKFKEKLICQNETFIADSQVCSIVKATKSDKKPVKVLYFASSGADTYYIGHVQDENYSVDLKLLETAEENDIDWDSYDYIVVPNVQYSADISDKTIDKFRKAVTNYSDGSDGSTPFYEFDDKMFANCIYSSSRYSGIKWLTVDEKELTRSTCYFKHDLFTKHGFKFFSKVLSSEDWQIKDLNIYVNTKK